jgi:hypothetical protein
MHVSRRHQTAETVRIFHRIISSFVLKTVGVMQRVLRAFNAFDNPDRYIAQVIELRIFPECDKVLLPWLCGIEPWIV